MSFFLVPALVTLRDEVNTRFSHRDKASDGWIGDPSHQARKSSHNPDWAHGGAVRAIDVDIDDKDPTADLRLMVVEAARHDKRVWYVISNGVIYSRTYGFAPRKYKGSNGHFKHVHVSVVENPAKWTDTTRWLSSEPVWKWNPEAVSDLALVQKQFQIAAGARKGARKRYHGVATIQNALNVSFLPKGQKLAVDGWAGRATVNAWRGFEAKKGGTGREITPDPVSLKHLRILDRFRGQEAQ
ncbi:hypothetical protein AB0F44_16775 [Nocardioides sp. NPDC023903]|uniref:hypothetical protein n=1 Tax=Nocardioides sp. NPDC023903 TaxID=3157195 RepID=UPI0033F9461E